MSFAELINADLNTFQNNLSKCSLIEFETLITNSPDLNMQNIYGYSCLHILCMINASLSKPVEKINMLINAGANVNIKNKYGETPLHTAYQFSIKNICEIHFLRIQLLIDNGSDVNSVNNGDISVLCYACMYYTSVRSRGGIWIQPEIINICDNVLMLLLNSPHLKILFGGPTFNHVISFKNKNYNPIFEQAIDTAIVLHS